MPTIYAESFAELYSIKYLLVYLSICALNSVLILFSSGKFLLAFQQTGYNPKKYLKWVNSKQNSYYTRLWLLCLLAFLFFCVMATTFAPIVGNVFEQYVGFFPYILFTAIYINTEQHVNEKIRLKLTKRLVRLCITYFIVIFALSFGLHTLMNFIAYSIKSEVVSMLIYSVFCITPILATFFLLIAHYINKPLETLISRHYISVAKSVLSKSDIIKIGITGSYGKTSVKKILTSILSEKYRVLSSPESYNTPLGISLTVKMLDSTHDVFIAEMGARQKGDISDLAKLVKPQYAVLTGVSTQHLETFITQENIKETKFELFENLDKNGVGFFSSDNKISLELFNRFSGTKYNAGVTDCDSLAYATDIKVSSLGADFVLHIKGEEPIKCNTSLLGKHNISNICLASSVAYKIGLKPNEIGEGINRLKVIEHRLELVRNNKEITIIDDSYNSNEEGVKSALEVLSSFEGRKIVLTPGLIELGKRENVANYEFGKLLAEKADKVIIIGKHNAEMLIKGLFDAGKTNEDVIFAKNLNKGNICLNEIMQKGDVVLFENDLPDTYN